MWIVSASLRSAFSQASGCSMKAFEPDLNSWASECARSCSLNGKLTLSLSWLLGWKREAYIQRLFGSAISLNSMQDDFAEWWIASLPDSRARTCPSLAGALASTGRDPASSSRSSASPTIAMRGSSFWRTSEASLLPPPPLWTRKRANSKSERSPASWENWPTAGGMRNGSLFQRPTWAPAIDGNAGSALHGEQWMTPCVPNGGRAVSAEVVANKGSTETGKKTVGLESQVRHVWATPRATDGEKGGPNCRGGRGDPILAGQVCQWPTPVANDDNKTPEAHMAMKARMKGGPRNTITSLQVLVQTWPTPTAQDSEQAGGAGTIQRGMRGHSLNSAAMLASAWPTPAARDGNGANSEEHALVTGGGRKHMDQLANFVAYSPLAQPILDGRKSSPTALSSPRQSPLVASVSGGTTRPDLSERKRLNPAFATWLMGWPWWWTNPEPRNFGASEMASWRCALQQQLSCFFGGLGSMDSDLTTRPVAVALSVAQGGVA